MPLRPRLLAAVFLAAVATVFPLTAADKTEEYPSGKAKGKYKVDASGEKDGAFTEFYENGKVRAKGTYKAGQLQGAHTTYYPSGATLSAAKYEAGVLTGKYTENTPQGAVRLTMTYKDGAATTLQLNAGGKLVAEQNLQAGDWMPPRRLAENTPVASPKEVRSVALDIAQLFFLRSPRK